MARVPYVQREQLKPEEQKHFDAIAGSRGRVGPNFQTLLNSPEAGGRFAGFGEYVRFHGDVPERLKELAIITAAREAPKELPVAVPSVCVAVQPPRASQGTNPVRVGGLEG